MKTCLICDDHPLVRAALADMLGRILPDVQVLQAADFTTGQTKMAQAQPDLCLTDLHMPGASPLAGVQALCAAAPDAVVVVVTGSDDDDLMLALLGQGVAGFIDKTGDLALAEAAVRLVLSGGRYLPPRILHLLPGAPLVPKVPAPRAISHRQAEVMDLVAIGMATKDIARRLAVAPSTVKTHLEQSMRRLGADNRLQAAQVWRQARVMS